MESHPNHLSAENLDAIQALGVQHMSIGVESLVDRQLQTLCRPYTVSQVTEAVGRAVSHGFTCVNVDVMFALPGQTETGGGRHRARAREAGRGPGRRVSAVSVPLHAHGEGHRRGHT